MIGLPEDLRPDDKERTGIKIFNPRDWNKKYYP